ncbi:Capsid assembly protein UL37, partial [Folsomia candida]
MSSCHPLPYAATPTYANHTFFNNQRQRILFLLHRSNPPPHPTSPPHPSSPQTNFSCIRHNSETPTLQQSSPTKALSTPAADTINLCLPSPPQPKILVRHMGHQLSPPLPQIYPRILRHVPEFYLIPPLVVTPHVPSDIDHAIDSYTLPAWRNNTSSLPTPSNTPESPRISKNLTTNPVEHPGITPNFKNLTTNPIEHPGVTPNFQKNLTTNPVEHPGITPNFKNLTTNPVEHSEVTPNFKKKLDYEPRRTLHSNPYLTTHSLEHSGLTMNTAEPSCAPPDSPRRPLHIVENVPTRFGPQTCIPSYLKSARSHIHSGDMMNSYTDLGHSSTHTHAKETRNFEIQTILDFHLDAEYTPSCDNALSHSGDLLDMIEGVSSTCPVSKNDAHRDTAGNEDPASTKSRNIGGIDLDHIILNFQPIRRVTLHTIAFLEIIGQRTSGPGYLWKGLGKPNILLFIQSKREGVKICGGREKAFTSNQHNILTFMYTVLRYLPFSPGMESPSLYSIYILFITMSVLPTYSHGTVWNGIFLDADLTFVFTPENDKLMDVDPDFLYFQIIRVDNSYSPLRNFVFPQSLFPMTEQVRISLRKKLNRHYAIEKSARPKAVFVNMIAS